MSQASEAAKSPAFDPESVKRIRKAIIKWGKKNYRPYPWRAPDKLWHGLIAEVLLQRTRAESVVPVYEKFQRIFPDPDTLSRARVQKIEKIIYPLGLRWRAPLLKQLGKQLAGRGGQVPADVDELLSLSGVGPYVAAAWLGFHGGKRSVIVDANVVRLICRLTGQPMDGETRRQKWLIGLADSLTPIKTWKAYNYAVLDFSMNICIRHPKCDICPIGTDLCQYRTQTFKAKGEKQNE